MAAAAAMLIGTHDVAAFAAGGEGVPWSDRRKRGRGTVRTIHLCTAEEAVPWWGAEPPGQLVEIRIVADAFLPRMVRGIVGALVEIGQGNRARDWMAELLAGQDRRLGPMNAPAHGLTLWRVGYANDPID
jgi:tRNA pseudouridine38-40 synthase